MNALSSHDSGKRILLINGSPHKSGPTSQLISAFLEGIGEGNIVTRVDCFALQPLPCDGCGYCAHRDGCSKRDLEEYYADLEEADILVYAFPIYNLSFPAPLKAILDRGQRYWSARFIRNVKPPIRKPKQVVLMTVSGDSRTEEGGLPEGVVMAEKQLRLPLTILHAHLTAAVHYYGADVGNPIEPYVEQARAAARLVCGG